MWALHIGKHLLAWNNVTSTISKGKYVHEPWVPSWRKIPTTKCSPQRQPLSSHTKSQSSRSNIVKSGEKAAQFCSWRNDIDKTLIYCRMIYHHETLAEYLILFKTEGLVSRAYKHQCTNRLYTLIVKHWMHSNEKDISEKRIKKSSNCSRDIMTYLIVHLQCWNRSRVIIMSSTWCYNISQTHNSCLNQSCNVYSRSLF
jgi:hypothetical protein